MSADYLVNPAVFLIDTLVTLYVFALLMRLLFQWFDADFYNPISQVLVKITHPPLRVLRRFVPSVGRLDTAAVVLMLVLRGLADYAVMLLQGVSVAPQALAVRAFGELLDMTLNVFLFALIIRAVLSWFGSAGHNAAVPLLVSLTEPLMRPFRRWLPRSSGMDFSPLVVLLVIQLARMLLLPPIHQLAVILS